MSEILDSFLVDKSKCDIKKRTRAVWCWYYKCPVCGELNSKTTESSFFAELGILEAIVEEQPEEECKIDEFIQNNGGIFFYCTPCRQKVSIKKEKDGFWAYKS